MQAVALQVSIQSDPTTKQLFKSDPIRSGLYCFEIRKNRIGLDLDRICTPLFCTCNRSSIQLYFEISTQTCYRSLHSAEVNEFSNYLRSINGSTGSFPSISKSSSRGAHARKTKCARALLHQSLALQITAVTGRNSRLASIPCTAFVNSTVSV